MGLCNSLITACFAFLPEVSKNASENTQKMFLFSFHNKTCDVNPFNLKALATCSENLSIWDCLSSHREMRNNPVVKSELKENWGKKHGQQPTMSFSGVAAGSSRIWASCLPAEGSKQHWDHLPLKAHQSTQRFTVFTYWGFLWWMPFGTGAT